MTKFKDEVKAFYVSGEDYGEKPMTGEPMTEGERKLSTLAMAINATVVQMVLEGVLPQEEQLHFMAHLGDFANRLFDGEKLKMPGTVQTLALDSEAARLYLRATELEFTQGTETLRKIKAAQQAFLDEQPTNKNEEGDIVGTDRPKYLN